MPITTTIISEWFDKGVEDEFKWMFVVCDTFNYEDYPVYLRERSEFKEKFEECNKNMQKVIECYNLSKDKESQVSQYRCWEWPE